ncbi:MAG: glycosyltransferase family 39 protein [Gammaproteobacteria bacterium]|nr:glycosyltransferase family 39 protein [Gammaproteobacteria bacterium]MBV9621560.1 glycosyltransferase family 39 protein [Gammaproteobacteria bacterium]
MTLGNAAGRTATALGAAGWLLLALAWFATTPLRALLDPDEGRYAEIPREMLQSGDWVTPRLNGLLYFEKPPLQYWATAAAYRLFGTHPWSSRLWAFALAFLCLALVAACARRLYGPGAALAAVLALATSPFFVLVGHLDLLDQGFTLWLCTAVLGFACAQGLAPAAQRRVMLFVWGAAALAVLSKGIVVGVLGGATLLLYSLLERDWRPWQRLHPVAGVAIFLLLSAPWFVLVSWRNPSFPAFFFVHEHFARFLTTVHQRYEPWYYFLPLLVLAVLPWSAALARGVRRAWREPAGAGEFRPARFLLLFAAVTLLFFSASGSKLAPYILPMLPPLAVLAAAATDPARLARGTARIGALLVLLVAVGLLLYSARRNSYVPHAALWWSSGAVAAALLAVPLSAVRPVRLAALAAALGGILAWQCLLCAYSVIPPARSAAGLAAALRPFVAAQTRLYSVGQYRETLSPYLGRTLQLVDFEGELQFGLTQEPQERMSLQQFLAHWRREPGAIAFVDPRRWEQLRQAGMRGTVLAADDDTAAVMAP